MSNFDGATISIDELRGRECRELLAEADVVIAIDAATHDEEVVYGRHEWDLATAASEEDELVVLRVELDMEAGDLEWLVEMIEAVESGELDEPDDDLDAEDDVDD
ncbi:MAG: hypothetical protein PVJ57_08870 [Phycisphaerae bacterium]